MCVNDVSEVGRRERGDPSSLRPFGRRLRPPVDPGGRGEDVEEGLF